MRIVQERQRDHCGKMRSASDENSSMGRGEKLVLQTFRLLGPAARADCRERFPWTEKSTQRDARLARPGTRRHLGKQVAILVGRSVSSTVERWRNANHLRVVRGAA